MHGCTITLGPVLNTVSVSANHPIQNETADSKDPVVVPGRYRYRVLDTKVLLGIDIESLHFLNNGYLESVGK